MHFTVYSLLSTLCSLLSTLDSGLSTLHSPLSTLHFNLKLLTFTRRIVTEVRWAGQPPTVQQSDDSQAGMLTRHLLVVALLCQDSCQKSPLTLQYQRALQSGSERSIRPQLCYSFIFSLEPLYINIL